MNLETVNKRKQDAEKMAEKYKWMLHDYQQNIAMISFIKDGRRINIYLTTMTVTTQIKHTKKGKTQLFRKGIGWE